MRIIELSNGSQARLEKSKSTLEVIILGVFIRFSHFYQFYDTLVCLHGGKANHIKGHE